MKLSLYVSFFTAAALACLAGLDYSDIARWGLVRRADVAALLPAEGYRMVCTTNVAPSFAWFLNGSMSSADEGNPTVLECVDVQIPGMPKELVLDGTAGLYPIPELGWYVGPFSVEWDMNVYSGFGVLSSTTDPWNGVSCWSEGFTPGADTYTCGTGFGSGYYSGYFALTRTDYPDIVTVTTNYIAVGNGAVLRDYTNPDKFARLEDGVFKAYEVVRTPAHWEFQGEPCFPLTNPLTPFSGSLAGYTWSTETSGEPPYLFYALYDEYAVRVFASGPIDGATLSLDFLRDAEPYDTVTMLYVGASVTTNSL